MKGAMESNLQSGKYQDVPHLCHQGTSLQESLGWCGERQSFWHLLVAGVRAPTVPCHKCACSAMLSGSTLPLTPSPKANPVPLALTPQEKFV